jgi:HAD superfamily hydrolase (TIGR01509 family)
MRIAASRATSPERTSSARGADDIGWRVTTVLFDVDGTLVDSNAAHAQTWTRAFREHGVHAEEGRIRSLVGVGADKLVPLIAGVAEDSPAGRDLTRRKKQLFDELLPTLQPTHGARALVEHLRGLGIRLAVATSAGEDEMRLLLDRAGVADLMPVRTSKDDAAASKPDPDIVQSALRKVNGDPESAVLIGDTPYDIEAGARAHVRTIAVRCGGHWSDRDLAGAAAIFDDPAALLAAWRQQLR